MHARPDDADKVFTRESTSELLRQRDAAALEELLKRYRPLMRVLVNEGLNPALKAKVDASDLVQDACAEIAKSFTTIQCDRTQPFLAYIRRIVVSKLVDVQRRFLFAQKRDVRLERSGAMNFQSQLDACPLNSLMEQELWDHTQAALAKLPPEIRKLIEFRYVDNMSFVKIGKMLDRNPDSIRISMDRWLDRVRQELRTQFYTSSSTASNAPTPPNSPAPPNSAAPPKSASSSRAAKFT